MRDLEAYFKKSCALLDNLKIPYGDIKELRVNSRATTRWGLCKGIAGGYRIEISSVLLDERNPESALMETILHELLHTCYGCQNHGKRWKAYADKIYRAYDYRIKTTNSSGEKGIVVETRAKHIAHRFRCRGCGAVVERQRESNFTRNYSAYRCSKCGGKFEKIF